MGRNLDADEQVFVQSIARPSFNEPWEAVLEK